HRETAVDLLREDWDATARRHSETSSVVRDEGKNGDPLDNIMAWLSVADLDEDDPQSAVFFHGGGQDHGGQAVAQFPQRPLRRKQSNYCDGDEELVPFGESADPEEEEWNRRFRRTGAAGRMVSYHAGDRPLDDLTLR
ncbi:GIP, partial [Symbiodinium pilosum]